MSLEEFDVAIIGGGPGGSTVATLVARRGRRVVLFEKEKFPRFHIGESLLPRNMEVFEELGVVEKLEQHGFQHKYGGEFVAGNGEGGATFRFIHALCNRYYQTYQVLRSDFDKLLLDHSRENGADVREENAVREVRILPPHGVEVDVESAGRRQTIQAKMLVDASGRDTFLANKFKTKQPINGLKKVAIYAHYRGGYRPQGKDAGNTVIVRADEHSWFWMIPMKEDRVSVGLVTDAATVRAFQGEPAELFRLRIEQSPVMSARLKDAELISKFIVTSDFSYQSRQFVGDHWLLVGDSAVFLDPIFSTGVFLAMDGGSRAARLIEKALAKGDFSARMFRSYERERRKHIGLYFEMIFNYYRPELMDLFAHPKNVLNVQRAINSMLAGNVDGGIRLRSRMYVFYGLMRLQRKYGLVPRIDFSRIPEKPKLFAEDCCPPADDPSAVKREPHPATT